VSPARRERLYPAAGAGARLLALAAALWLLLPAAPVLAQDAAPENPPSAPPGGWPTPSAIAAAIFDQAGTWLTSWLEHSVPALATRGFLALLGAVARFLWGTVAGLLGGANFVTQLPEQWVVGLAPVQRTAGRLTELTLVGVGVDVLLTIALLVASVGLGRPFGGLVPYFGRQAIAGALLALLGGGLVWVLRFANALSGALTDPLTGLAGLEAPTFDAFTATAALLLVYAVALLWFLIRRARVLVLVALLMALWPVAVLAWCTPLPFCDGFARGYAKELLGLMLVQVPQAAALAIGAALVASAFAGGDAGSGGGPAEGAVALLMGTGSVGAAAAMPGIVSRHAARATVGLRPGQVATAARVATILAGFGWAGPAAAPPVYAVREVARAVPGIAAGAAGPTRSLLGDPPGAPKLLPPPR
jgi:hypothetical protein